MAGRQIVHYRVFEPHQPTTNTVLHAHQALKPPVRDRTGARAGRAQILHELADEPRIAARHAVTRLRTPGGVSCHSSSMSRPVPNKPERVLALKLTARRPQHPHPAGRHGRVVQQRCLPDPSRPLQHDDAAHAEPRSLKQLSHRSHLHLALQQRHGHDQSIVSGHSPSHQSTGRSGCALALQSARGYGFSASAADSDPPGETTLGSVPDSNDLGHRRRECGQHSHRVLHRAPGRTRSRSSDPGGACSQ